MTDAQLNDAIAEADSVINGYIGRYYSVPAVALPPSTDIHPIDYWSRNIAAYNATLTYAGRQDFADQDPIARRYLATMEALKAVGLGQMTLVGIKQPDSGGSAAAAGAMPPYSLYVGNLFSSDDFNLSPAGSGGTYLGDNPRPWPWDFSQW